MIHLDLFSGIGGFAYAADQVWDDVEHIFCDNNKFCQQVIDKHWKGSKIYDDIRDIKEESADIVTGGFPCQPFSQAGKRRGTEDDRHLWPEMYRVIKLTKPRWVVAENVPGLINIQEGVVFEQVCADLEAEGYEVQPFIIPAVAVNAPHKRDRLWIIAHAEHLRRDKTKTVRQNSSSQPKGKTGEKLPVNELKRVDSLRTSESGRDGWDTDWLTVATRVCRVDDGLPNRVDRVKALGNSIVPRVAIEIMRGIE